MTIYDISIYSINILIESSLSFQVSRCAAVKTELGYDSQTVTAYNRINIPPVASEVGQSVSKSVGEFLCGHDLK